MLDESFNNGLNESLLTYKDKLNGGMLKSQVY